MQIKRLDIKYYETRETQKRNPWWWCDSANHIVNHGKKENKNRKK